MLDLTSKFENNPFLKSAAASFAQGLPNDAIGALSVYLAENPDCGRGWELTGIIYHSWRRWHEACVVLEEASILVPLIAEAESALADCYLVVGRTTWAEQLYRNVVRRRNVSAACLRSAAAGLDTLSESQLAVAACRRAIQMSPLEAQSHYDLSHYLSRSGASVCQVEAAARRAISLAPAHVPYRVGLAGFLHCQQRSEDAAALLGALTIEHVQSICCRCCLLRLLGLFEAVGQAERAAWCTEQLQAL